MAVFHDTAASGHITADVAVGGPTTSTGQDDAVARDYAAHRGAVLAMLRADFPRLGDHDELYQEAWAELLELRARGEVIHNVRALLKKIAWRRAADQVRRRRADAVDPSSPVLAFAPDLSPLPDETAQVRLDAEALRLVVESLDPRQAAVLKLRFDLQLSAKEIQERLGVSPKRLEKIVTEAYKQVAERLGDPDDADSRWVRRQRSLLLACEVGIASSRQRRRAQEMVDRDPRCRALLREMRAALHDVAAVLPVPVIVEGGQRLRSVEIAVGRLDDLWTSAKHATPEVVQRVAPASNVAEHVGVGGAALTAGATVKVVAACLAAGGVAAFCVQATNFIPSSPPARDPMTTRPRVVEPPAKAMARPVVTSVATQPAPAKPEVRPPREEQRQQQRPAPRASSSRSTPPPSPAPAGSTEFGPGAVGSAVAPQAPAQAPADGGGEFTP